MVQAIVFDCFGVLAQPGAYGYVPDDELLNVINADLVGTYRMGILSNTTRGSLERIFRNKELDIFEVQILSGDVGLYKPDQAMYELAAARLGCVPETCVMVDDVEQYVIAARTAGMQAVHYKNAYDFKKSFKSILM